MLVRRLVYLQVLPCEDEEDSTTHNIGGPYMRSGVHLDDDIRIPSSYLICDTWKAVNSAAPAAPVFCRLSSRPYRGLLVGPLVGPEKWSSWSTSVPTTSASDPACEIKVFQSSAVVFNASISGPKRGFLISFLMEGWDAVGKHSARIGRNV